MKRSIILSIVFIALLTLNAFANIQEGAPEKTLEYAPGRMLVKFTESAVNDPAFNANRGSSTGLESVDQLNETYNVTNINKSHEVINAQLDEQIGVSRWHTFSLPETSDIERIAGEYATDANVEYATPDWKAYLPAAVAESDTEIGFARLGLQFLLVRQQEE